MSDSKDSSTEQWNKIVAEDAAATPVSAQSAAPKSTLPELPHVIGRLPINCNTKRAILHLPQPYKGIHCAALFHNVTVLSECDRPADDVCRQPSLYARPLDDRRIEVVLAGGGTETTEGLGWKEGAYPGGQLETRPVPIGVPVVEVMVVAGRSIDCGCDTTNWASDDWGV